MIKYIIDKGVDLECVDNDGWKPIHYICRYSTPKIIKYIIDKGVDVPPDVKF
jgi:ankyrin repeat protein